MEMSTTPQKGSHSLAVSRYSNCNYSIPPNCFLFRAPVELFVLCVFVVEATRSGLEKVGSGDGEEMELSTCRMHKHDCYSTVQIQ